MIKNSLTPKQLEIYKKDLIVHFCRTTKTKLDPENNKELEIIRQNMKKLGADEFETLYASFVQNQTDAILDSLENPSSEYNLEALEQRIADDINGTAKFPAAERDLARNELLHLQNTIRPDKPEEAPTYNLAAQNELNKAYFSMASLETKRQTPITLLATILENDIDLPEVINRLEKLEKFKSPITKQSMDIEKTCQKIQEVQDTFNAMDDADRAEAKVMGERGRGSRNKRKPSIRSLFKVYKKANKSATYYSERAANYDTAKTLKKFGFTTEPNGKELSKGGKVILAAYNDLYKQLTSPESLAQNPALAFPKWNQKQDPTGDVFKQQLQAHTAAVEKVIEQSGFAKKIDQGTALHNKYHPENPISPANHALLHKAMNIQVDAIKKAPLGDALANQLALRRNTWINTRLNKTLDKSKKAWGKSFRKHYKLLGDVAEIMGFDSKTDDLFRYFEFFEPTVSSDNTTNALIEKQNEAQAEREKQTQDILKAQFEETRLSRAATERLIAATAAATNE